VCIYREDSVASWVIQCRGSWLTPTSGWMPGRTSVSWKSVRFWRHALPKTPASMRVWDSRPLERSSTKHIRRSQATSANQTICRGLGPWFKPTSDICSTLSKHDNETVGNPVFSFISSVKKDLSLREGNVARTRRCISMQADELSGGAHH
jgi:hypothetical protein